MHTCTYTYVCMQCMYCLSFELVGAGLPLNTSILLAVRVFA